MPSGVEEVRIEETQTPQTESKELTHNEENNKEMQTNNEQPTTAATATENGPEAAAKPKEDDDSRRQVLPTSSTQSGEEGVEVVLGDKGASNVVGDEKESKVRTTPDQNVFRHPQTTTKPRSAMRGGPPQYPPHPPPPYGIQGSGSWGYAPPPPQHYGHPSHPPPPGAYPHEYPPRPPYPVPPYSASGSFDDQGSYHRTYSTPHYTPHVPYPPPQGRYGEDVNVISPHHTTADPNYRPAISPRPRHMQQQPPRQGHYQYPPPSPIHPGPPSSGPPRVRDYAISRRNGGADGPYSKAQQPRGTPGSERRPGDAAWNTYGRSPSGDMSRASSTGRPQPPLVTESSFDSEHRSSHRGSVPNTPKKPPQGSEGPPRAPSFYGPGSWGSFDSAPLPPAHYEDHRYYAPPPESPYHYSMGPYSPVGSFYHTESFPPPPSYAPSATSFAYSYDEEERIALRDYHPDRDGDEAYHSKQVTPTGKKSRSKTPVSSNTSNANNMLLPKAAEEIDFDVVDPPAEPKTLPSEKPICESLADVNTYDVLCGRGGGTNSQIGNRRFRKLVQDFQPTYLLARRKEKPLLARTIVLIIRKRGGRFLKKDEDTGEMFEVGDEKAEAKTSQALREGLDVRATKSAASSLLEKKKRLKQSSKKDDDLDEEDEDDEDEVASPSSSKRSKADPSPGRDQSRHNQYHYHGRPRSPPPLPPLQGEEAVKSAVANTPQHGSAPDAYNRKRRRMRGGYTADRFFPDFCPPRADLATRPPEEEGFQSGPPPPYAPQGYPYHPQAYPPGPTSHHPHPHQYPAVRRNPTDDIRLTESTDQQVSSAPAPSCAGIALDVMSGASGSFCLTPTGWRR